jgi:hypothetical protein
MLGKLRSARRATLIASMAVPALLIALGVAQPFASPASAGEFVVTIDASPDTDINLVGTDHTVDALVMIDGAPGGPDWFVLFNVTAGPNTGDGDSGLTDANGEISFTYTGDGGLGEDTIEVCVEGQVGANAVSVPQDPLDCEEVTKTWVDPTPTPTPTPTPEPEPTATPTPTPDTAADTAADTEGPSALPDTGSTPSGGGFPLLGAIMLSLAGAALAAAGWALTNRAR